ncbi:transglutaminase domain-containing protein [Candidatus Woesearchaeota archaeon]|nr:transglutaminase domain-containing protein [Candidatus Woesearchaeota archaeon]
MRWLVLVFLLIVPVSFAFESYHTSSSVSLETEISSRISNVNNVQMLKINLSFFPRNSEFQEITNEILPANSDRKTDYIFTEYEDIDYDELDYNVEFNLVSDFEFKEIKSKIFFPIEDVPEEYEPYLIATDYINSDDDLVEQTASEIIGDEDDLYEAVFKLGEWAHENINYSLETLTEELTQDSIWVLENKKGVCDELTVLFIAMLRSQGIPAKFISGQAYTSLIPGFGNHAWAEVYFPGKGWVPFDVTYGQYGYVDATHIKMKESVFARETSIRYIWSSGDIQISPGNINITTNVVSEESKMDRKVNININLLRNEIKTGSSLPVEIELENLGDYYIATTLQITKSASSIENNLKPVLLKPKESKKVYWIIPLPELDHGFIYTSEIEMVDFFGSSDSETVEYSDDYPYYSLQEAEDKVYSLSLENRNPESGLDFFCNPDKISYYDYQNATLICKVINSETKNYDLDLCFLEECKGVQIEKGEMQVIFNIPLSNGETKEYNSQLRGSGIIKNSYFDVNVIPSPNLRIAKMEYSSTITYGSDGEILFSLDSQSPAKEVTIKLNNKKLFYFEAYDGSDNFEIPFSSSYFYRHRDSKIRVSYKDFNDAEYNFEEDVVMDVTNAPFYIAVGYWWFLILGAIIATVILRRKFFRFKDAPKPRH